MTEIACFQQTSAPASRFKVDLNLESMQDPTAPVISTRAAVVDTIAGNLPDTTLAGVRDLNFLQDLQLADPDFDQPGRVDLLLGVDIFAKILKPGNSPSEDGELHAINSVFGWLVTGTHYTPVYRAGVHICLKASIPDMQTHQLMRAFWEVEETPSDRSQHSTEDQSALDQYRETVDRNLDGRYVVRLPRRTLAAALGCS